MATVATRVARIAEAALAEQQFVTPIDVLVRLGWLAQPNVDRWQRGRVFPLISSAGVDAAKTLAAVDALREWAQTNGLQAWDTNYGDRRFTADGDADLERAYRTRWATTESHQSTELRARPQEITVMAVPDSWTCARCNEHDSLMLKDNAGAVCLDCADLAHLEFLPAGDAAMTRRAKKASRLSAVVVRWNKRRNRYERQGILAENDAIDLAAQQCLDDADARAMRRERDAVRRVAIDEKFRDQFAAAIRDQFPGCPPERADAIALHAALRGSGRVGRSAAGRALDPKAVRLAVGASVRHLDTDYDDLLMSGVDRDDARARIADRIDDVLDAWR